MTPRRFNIYIKPLSWTTQRKNKLELNAEIIARIKDIQDISNFHSFRKVFYAKSTFLHSNINLQNTQDISLSNHILKMRFPIWNTYIL